MENRILDEMPSFKMCEFKVKDGMFELKGFDRLHQKEVELLCSGLWILTLLNSLNRG
jgi:hypothetical protein